MSDLTVKPAIQLVKSLTIGPLSEIDRDYRFGATAIGIPGPRGQAGASGFIHNQVTPAATWIINHNLARKPSVTIYDSLGEEVAADVFASDTIVSVVFAIPAIGQAVLV